MDKTTLAYDNNAERYADKFMAFAPYAEKIRRFRDRYVTEDSTLLDLGCGPGDYGEPDGSVTTDIFMVAQGSTDC